MIRSICTAVLLLAGTTASAKVVLPHKSLADSEACPGFQKVDCAPDDDPTFLKFNLVPPALEIDANGQPSFDLFIGRAFRQPFLQGMIGRYCDAGASNPFAGATLDTRSATSGFEYKFKLKSELSANAQADLVTAAKSAGLPDGLEKKLSAAAKTAYNKARTREVVTTGRAILVRMRDADRMEILYGNDNALAKCRNFLRSNHDFAIVKAMMVFHIEGSTANSTVDETLVADLKASLKGTEAENIAAVNSAIESTVGTQIQSVLKDRYLVWSVSWLKYDSQ